MFLRALLLTWMSSCMFIASAQDLVAEFAPKNPKSKILNLLLAHEKDAPIGVCYLTPNFIVVQSIGNDGQLIYQKEIQGQWDAYSPLGAIKTEHTYQFIYYNKTSLKFIAVSAGKTDESLTKGQIMAPYQTGEKPITSIVSDNKLYSIGWDKENQKLNVGRFIQQEGRFDIKNIPLSDELSDILRSSDITPMTDATLPEPSNALDKRKIYLLPSGKIAITVEGKAYEKCQTELVLIDWEQGSIDLKYMGPPVSSSGFQASTNSFIYGANMALFRIEPDLLYLAVHDLNKHELIQAYNFTKNDTLEIMNSRLFSESESYSVFTDTRSFSKDQTQKVLRKLSKGKPFIFFEPSNDGNMVFTMGNYIEQKSGGGGFTPGIPGATIGSPGGAVYLPGTPGSFSPYGKSYMLSRYFYSLLGGPRYEHLPEAALDKQFLSKKLKDFVEKHIESKSGRLFRADPIYEIVNIPGANYALVVSYLKKEGMIKVNKIDL